MYGFYPIIWMNTIIMTNLSYSKASMGNFVYRFKRKHLLKWLVILFSTVYAIFYVIELIDKGKSSLLVIGYIALICAMIVLSILNNKNEGITEEGIIFSSGFLKWESIIDFGWKPHFTKKHIYINLRLRSANNTIYEKFIAVSKEGKDEIERLLSEQLENNRVEDKQIDSTDN